MRLDQIGLDDASFDDTSFDDTETCIPDLTMRAQTQVQASTSRVIPGIVWRDLASVKAGLRNEVMLDARLEILTRDVGLGIGLEGHINIGWTYGKLDNDLFKEIYGTRATDKSDRSHFAEDDLECLNDVADAE